jgi:transposase
MARGYIPVDQQFLIPPDIREWLSSDHLVWFLLEVVDRLDTGGLHRRRRRGGQGRAGYDPDMLLALLIYAYCTKVRSSRQIERLCETDVAFRVICAGHRPDHTTIARFRQEHGEWAEKLFADVLEICADAGLARVGVVAVDGTKIAGNASRDANRTRAWLEAEIAGMFAEAAETDTEEDDRFGSRRGDELPAGLADPQTRREALAAALGRLDQREIKRAGRDPARIWAGRVEQTEQKLDVARRAWQARQGAKAARGEKRGRPPRHPDGKAVAELEQRLEHLRAKAASLAPRPAGPVNLTDPDSRLMPTANGWVQGYNAQLAVNETGVIVAAEVFCQPSDQNLLRPMIAALDNAQPVLGPVGVLLADAGYCSEENLTCPGPARLIAVTNARATRNDARPPTCGPPPAHASPVQAMDHTLRTPEGRHLYKQRSWTVEPGIGNLKTNLGFTRFARRGHHAARAEWQLITAAANLLKLHRYYPAAIRLA